MTPTSHDLVLTPKGIRFAGRLFPCSVGKGGVSTTKREGDGATPAGSHRLIAMLYRADRIAPPNDQALAVGPNDLWSDDVEDVAYNSLVRRPYPHSHERLFSL